MTSPSECEDKDCVTCRMRVIAQELADDDVPVDLAAMLLFTALGEAYGIEFGVGPITEAVVH